MKGRIAFLALVLGLAPLPSFAQSAADFPTGPVKMIVPFAAGGPTDVVARFLNEQLSQRWGGKAIVIENRPGAGTVIGSSVIAKAQPDGYTVGMIVNSFMTTAALTEKLPYDARKDFTPIAMIAFQPMALVATKSFPANNLKELIDYAKKDNVALNYTSPGPRGTTHLAGELFKMRAGLNMTHINYTGSAPALTDVVAGRVPLMFDVWHSAKRFVDTGELKLIAGLSGPRLKDAPDVPTIGEMFPGIEVVAMQAVVGPAGMPPAIVEKMSADINAVISSAEFAEKTKHLGIDPRPMTPKELGAFIQSEITNWGDVAAKAGISMN